MIINFLKKNTFLLIILLVLFFPFITKADDPWVGLKDISINNKEDYKSYCAATQFTGNKQLMRCDITVYDPKGATTKFQFDAIKKSYSNFVLVNDKTALNEDVQLRFTYTPNSDNYFLEGVNFFYKENGANKSEKGQASCSIITHCCCASIKDAAGNITGVNEKNCKQTFCDCGSNQRDITFCGVAPKAVPINGSTVDQISCNNKKCTKTDKSCTQDSDCTGYGGEGICKNAFCYLDDIGLEKYKTAPSLFGITADLQIKKPILEITIPQLKFSDVENNIDEEGNLTLPYIGEYMSAIYKVAMVAVSIVAVIMIIVQGVKITTLGGEARISGFKKIGQIAIGVFIAWGSYAILYNINPDLVNFKALKVKYIETSILPEYLTHGETTGEVEPGKQGKKHNEPSGQTWIIPGTNGFAAPLSVEDTCVLNKLGKTQEELEKNITNVTFLGKQIRVHSFIAKDLQERFKAVEGSTDPTIVAWLNHLKDNSLHIENGKVYNSRNSGAYMPEGHSAATSFIKKYGSEVGVSLQKGGYANTALANYIKLKLLEKSGNKDGTYTDKNGVPRKMSPSPNWLAGGLHALGLAFDIDYPHNPKCDLGDKSGTGQEKQKKCEELVKKYGIPDAAGNIFEATGKFVWLKKADPAHIEYAPSICE